MKTFDRALDVPAESLAPEGGQAALYLRAYLSLRFAIGVAGILLPVVLLIGDFWLSGSPSARGSLSAYYHSGMRDVFVGTLVVTGAFLVTYRVVNHRPTNVITTVAGVACIGVAFFPTEGEAGDPLTPLQAWLGEGAVGAVHFVSAAVFIGLLGVISIYFAREAKAKDPTSRWVAYHYACAAAIYAASAYVVVTKSTGAGDRYSLLIGETVAVLAFGASWLSKGLALRGLVLKGLVPHRFLPAA